MNNAEAKLKLTFDSLDTSELSREQQQQGSVAITKSPSDKHI